MSESSGASVKQDNAMSLTPEHLAAIAERLGEPYVVHSYFDFDLRERKRAIARETPAVLGDDESGHPVVLSPGDLLLAMLNRAAEMGYYGQLDTEPDKTAAMTFGNDLDAEGCPRNKPAWDFHYSHAGLRDRSLGIIEAVALAFIQLPLDNPPSGNLPSPSA